MDSIDKQEAINTIQNLSPECVTKENRYIDCDQLVCFNGAIALPYVSYIENRDDIDFVNDEVPEELDCIYDNRLTLQHINSIHYSYIKDKIPLDKAKKLVIRVIERFE